MVKDKAYLIQFPDHNEIVECKNLKECKEMCKDIFEDYEEITLIAEIKYEKRFN